MDTLIDKTLSHYRIMEKLGEGGMGVIYRAEDLKLKRTVALKVLTDSFACDSESKRRFIFEAQTASSLQHNNICTVHEIDETPGGQLFIAMDFYEGETLKTRIARGTLPLNEILDLARQIAEGLKKAHEQGVIHRDIKPANIFITGEGVVKILDFGLAKKLDRTQLTRGRVRFGTTEYMSPEQIQGEKLDARTDIWSWGIILYDMLAGQPPFQADYDQALIYLILNQELDDVREFRMDVPERLLDVLEKATAKERDERYDDMASLLEDLKQVAVPATEAPAPYELPAPRPSQSIAVMPFVNMSADPEQEYFCDGLTEELINTLSKINDLKVVARTSAFAFKGGALDVRKAGRKLDVRTVIEGSVRKSGNQIRITVQLINVSDGYHLWSERYDREVQDVFKIQDEISLAIVDVLKVKLLGDEKSRMTKRYTDNLEAYNLYLQGSYIFNQFNFAMYDRGLEYFQKALEKDPNYALAYLGLAYYYGNSAYFGMIKTCDASSLVRKYIQKVLEIDENLAETYSILGYTNAVFEWKWQGAERDFRRAVEMNPSSVDSLRLYSINRTSWGQFDIARKLVARAKAIDPFSAYLEITAAFPDFYEGKYDLALNQLSKFLDTTPPVWWGIWYLWRTLALLDRKQEAVEACKKSFAATGASGIVQAMENAGPDKAYEAAACTLADVYQQHYISPYDIAILFAHAGRREEALVWLETSLDVVDPKLHFLNVDPEWRAMHGDPRFVACLKRIGFVP